MRSILQLLLIGILVACNGNGTEEAIEIPANEIAIAKEIEPFQGLGIRHDGHYKNEDRGVVYLIRFFDNGNAVLINGRSDVAEGLSQYLVKDALGDPAIGWYNVPVTVKEDSIFFKTYPTKGEIEYRGNVPSTSTVRLLRHSHITGTQEIKDYIFQPDNSPSQ